MKKLLTLLFLGISITAISQQKKKTVAKLTEIQQVKLSAMSWFKNVYVENNFKDPYSYKVLKCDIYTTSNKESLERIISTLKSDSSSSDTTVFYSSYASKRQEYYKQVNNLKYYPTIYKQSDVDRAKKAWDNETDKFNKILFDKKEAEDLLSKLDITTSKKIAYYSVYIDCYSNNSYGNPVLGKYAFHYDKKGLVREPIRLNKE